MYDTELQFVADFQRVLLQENTTLQIRKTSTEFYYLSGRVDIIGVSSIGDLVSVEAKLARWTVALRQAYRNTSFSHYSYVVLPNEYVDRAQLSEGEFERRGVGLCSFNGDIISVKIPAKKSIPLQPWLTRKALKTIEEANI